MQCTSRKVDRLPGRLLLDERELILFSVFNVLVKHYKPDTARAKIAPVARLLGRTSTNNHWVLLPHFFDGLQVFCGTSVDDRLPLFLELFPYWHAPLDRDIILDSAIIAVDNCATYAMWRRREYSCLDAFAAKSHPYLDFSTIKISGYNCYFRDLSSFEIRNIIYECHELIIDDYDLFWSRHDCVQVLLQRSKTDLYGEGIWTVVPATRDPAARGLPELIHHWWLRLEDGEVINASSPVFGVRTAGVTFPVDDKVLTDFDKFLSASLDLGDAYKIRGHSRRKGGASSAFASGLDIGAVRALGRWSNGTVSAYVKMPNSTKVALLRRVSQHVLRNRREKILPPALAF